MNATKTSWGKVAEWYDELLDGNPLRQLADGGGTYQKDLILPNILRLLAIKKSEKILDLGCGQGFFAREFVKSGATVIGVDVAPELVARAKKHAPGAAFHVASADAMPFVKNKSVDAVVSILALQNIENVDGVLAECRRALRPNG